MSLEAPTTEIVSFKSSLVSIEISASYSSDADKGRAPRETTEKFGPESGVDLACILWGQGKKVEKNSGRLEIHDKIRVSFRPNSGPDSCRKIKNPRRAPTLVPSVLPHSGNAF